MVSAIVYRLVADRTNEVRSLMASMSESEYSVPPDHQQARDLDRAERVASSNRRNEIGRFDGKRVAVGGIRRPRFPMIASDLERRMTPARQACRTTGVQDYRTAWMETRRSRGPPSSGQRSGASDDR